MARYAFYRSTLRLLGEHLEGCCVHSRERMVAQTRTGDKGGESILLLACQIAR